MRGYLVSFNTLLLQHLLFLSLYLGIDLGPLGWLVAMITRLSKNHINLRL